MNGFGEVIDQNGDFVGELTESTPTQLPEITDPDAVDEAVKRLTPQDVRRVAAILRARRGKDGYSEAEGLRWHRIADQIELALEDDHA